MQQIWLHNCNEDHDHFNIIMIISCEAHPPCNSSPSLTFAGKRNVMKPQISFRSTELMWKVNLKRAASSKLPVQNQNNFLWTGKCWHTNTDLKVYEWIFVSCKDYIWFVWFWNIWKRKEFYTIEFAQSDHFPECFGLVEKIDPGNSDDLLWTEIRRRVCPKYYWMIFLRTKQVYFGRSLNSRPNIKYLT